MQIESRVLLNLLQRHFGHFRGHFRGVRSTRRSSYVLYCVKLTIAVSRRLLGHVNS